MFEEARALDGTIRLCKITQEALSEKLGVSQSYVANKLRLLKYSDELQGDVLAAGLSERHARAILRLPSDKARRLAIRRVTAEQMSVAMTEQLVELLLATEEGSSGEGVRERTVAQLGRLLGDLVGTLSSAGITARRTTEESPTDIRITLSIRK